MKDVIESDIVLLEHYIDTAQTEIKKISNAPGGEVYAGLIIVDLKSIKAKLKNLDEKSIKEILELIVKIAKKLKMIRAAGDYETVKKVVENNIREALILLSEIDSQ